MTRIPLADTGHRTPHTFLPPHSSRWHLTFPRSTLRSADHRISANPQLSSRIPEFERVPLPDDWGHIFADTTIAAALIDRLLHHCVPITINGDSYRLRTHKARTQTLTKRGPD